MKRIICALSLITAAAQAQDTTELTPVEVRAVRASGTAPFAKTNISSKELGKNNLGQDLPFLLNQTPSVVVNSDAGNGVGYTGIRIRGTDGTRVNVTLNGVPFNDPESQGSFFVDIPDIVSSTGSIQIQRGVGTSTNGVGSFGGSVNLTTNQYTPVAYARLSNSFGSFNTWKNTVNVGTGLIDGHFTLDARLSRISSDGYIDRARTDMRSFYLSAAYFLPKTDFRFNIFSGTEKTYQAWNGVSEADLKSNRTINYAGMEKPGTPYENETDNYWQTHYQFFVNHKISEHLTLSNTLFLIPGRGYYENYKANQKYSSYGMSNPGRSDMVRQLWLSSDFYGEIFSALYQQNATKLILGLNASKYDARHYGDIIWAMGGMPAPSVRYYHLTADKNDFSVFGKWEQQLGPKLTSFVDLQYRTVKYDLNGFRNNPALIVSNDFNFFNPKAGLSYKSGNWQAYASYSLGQKEPNRDDFEAGNLQQPKAEKLHDFELGMERSSGGFTTGLNFYYMKYTNQLVLTGQINDVGAYTRTNIPKSYRLGVEVQAGSRFTNWLSLQGNLTLSQNKIDGFTEYVDNYDDFSQKAFTYSKPDLAFSPAIVGAATLLIQPISCVELGLISKYVSRQYLDNTEQRSRSLNPYYTQDARIIFSFSHGVLKNAQLIGSALNVFDRKYEPNGYTFSYIASGALTTENYYFPMAGRNYMVGLNLNF